MAATALAIGTKISASDAEGRTARGTVIGRALGADGSVFAYEISNPVTGRMSQVYLDSYSITIR